MKKGSLLLIIILMVIPIYVNAETVQTGKFKYMPAFEEETEEVYYYSDDYFKNSGKTYNEHLMGMSFNLAISTFEIRGYSYSKKLLEDIGFSNFKAYDMEEKPTIDTIGMVIAHKKVDGKNLIAIAVRGEKYDSEWGNNFIVGESGDAKGFHDSSIKVMKRIKEYISTNHLKKNKIWMVGYSRAGTITNLTGVYMNQHLNEFSATEDNLYFYTFESPSASIDNTIYENIYTIRSRNDLIPHVYPEEWGFYTNGQVIEMGTSKKIMTYKGLEVQEEYEEVELNEFYNQFFSWLTSRLDRKTYSKFLEGPVSKMFDIYFSKSPDDREKLKNFFVEDLKAEIMDNKENFNRIKPYVWAVMGHNSDYLYHKIVDNIIDIMNQIRNTPNCQVLTNEEYNFLVESLYPVIRVLGPIINDDTNYFDGIQYEEDYPKIAEDYLLTDEEMGTKYGQEDGRDIGYDAGFNGEEKNENSYVIRDDYGPDYETAFVNAYVATYSEYYDLGVYHKENLGVKGEYDAKKVAYNYGFDVGSYGEEPDLEDTYLYVQDWMNDDYINAYNNTYMNEYLRGYAAGLENPFQGEENIFDADFKQLYHVFSLVKNASEIMKQHYPQENLKLIRELDSYYAPYDLTEGANQTIIVNDTNTLTFKTSGHLEKLIKVEVDGTELNETEYDAKTGSTVITLKNQYLKSLSTGSHTMKMIYIDHEIETSFMVENHTSNIINPNTNDDIGNYVMMVIVSILCLIGTIINRKRLI